MIYKKHVYAVLMSLMIILLSSCTSIQHDQDSQLDLKVAQAAEKSNHPQIAIRNYELVLKEYPNDKAVQRKLVVLYQEVKDNQKAVSLLKKMLKEDSENTFAQYYYARVMQDMGLYQQAMEYYLGLQNDTDYASKTLNNVAVILARHDENHLAQSCWYEGLKRYPESATIRYNAALSIALNIKHPGPDTEAIKVLLVKSADPEVQKLLNAQHDASIHVEQKEKPQPLELKEKTVEAVKQLCDQ